MKTTDFLGNEWHFDCMGCAIADGSFQIPGGIICQTDHFRVHQDPLIPLPGFLVIASTNHIQSISEMDADSYQELATLIRISTLAIKAVVADVSLTLIQEERSRHFHLWFFPWNETLIASYGKPTLANIRAIMGDQAKHSISAETWRSLEATITELRTTFATLMATTGHSP